MSSSKGIQVIAEGLFYWFKTAFKYVITLTEIQEEKDPLPS